MVVNAARVSFGKRVQIMSLADKHLIKYLMDNRHGSPFEHNMFTFHIQVPLFVAREWFRHRIGSFNEFSARYAEMPDNFYSPTVEDIRTQVGKPGAYTYEKLSTLSSAVASSMIEKASADSYRTYLHLLSIGVAREQARSVLPMGTFTEFYWTVNARSLMNFLSLRTAPQALLEIRQSAEEVEVFFQELMPITYEAWVANGKLVP
jgi:thymidylate synthase (FAD)